MPSHRRNHNHTETQYVRLDTSRCEACWQCVEACPKKVLGKVDIFIHHHARIDHAENCRGCKKCVDICPQGALTTIEPAIISR